MSELQAIVLGTSDERALAGFAELMTHVFGLYTFGESSSVSEAEAEELAESALYVLGLRDDTVTETLTLLASPDVVGIWTKRRRALEARIPEVLQLWGQVASTMPPVRNIALRDTLASIGQIGRTYDTVFAAHEVPATIDYPLSAPVPEDLRGLDYVEAWLGQLLEEARFLARFDTDEIVTYLTAWCPDVCGLLINLYEPIRDAWERGQIAMAGKAGAPPEGH